MKNIFDMKHVRGVKAIALLKKGEMAGRIIANYSDNPAGSVCTVMVQIYGHKNGADGRNWATGTAGGGGYDKFSAAVSSALRSMGLLPDHDKTHAFTFEHKKVRLSGKIPVYSGSGNVRAAFEAAGYAYIEAI